MEYIELKWLCIHMKKVKSSHSCTEFEWNTVFPCEYRSLDLCEVGPKVCTMQGTCLFPALRNNGTLLLPGKLVISEKDLVANLQVEL